MSEDTTGKYTGTGEKLGTCDKSSPLLEPKSQLHKKTELCVNWREQPAQGEPRHEVRERLDANIKALRRGKPLPHPEGGETIHESQAAARANLGGDSKTAASDEAGRPLASPSEGMSAAQFQSGVCELATGIIVDFGRSNPNSEKFEHEVAKVEKRILDWAALKVREYEKGLLPRVNETLIACNREIAKLREERDALRADRKAFSKQLMNEARARERAESALAEARDGIHEVIMLLSGKASETTEAKAIARLADIKERVLPLKGQSR